MALLADGEGRIIGEGRAGAANLQTEGELEVEKILHTAIEEAVAGHAAAIAAVCLGMAGVDRTDDGATIRHVMQRLGFRANTVIVNDALIALVAGAGSSHGVVVVSGTGSIAYGVSRDGLAARAGGWGPTLADEGSGYWIGRRALVAVMRDMDGRGPATDLTGAVLKHFGLVRPDELVAEVYHSPRGRSAIAALGAVVDRARGEGDRVATDIMSQAGEELAIAAGSVIARLEMRGDQFPILLSGGMLRDGGWLASDVRRRMAEIAPRSTVEPLNEKPAIGAVRLALAEAHGGVRVPRYVDRSRPTPQ